MRSVSYELCDSSVRANMDCQEITIAQMTSQWCMLVLRVDTSNMIKNMSLGRSLMSFKELVMCKTLTKGFVWVTRGLITSSMSLEVLCGSPTTKDYRST